MHSFEELRQEYKEFLFRDYEILFEEDLCRVSFFYEIPGLDSFVTKWTFPILNKEGTRAFLRPGRGTCSGSGIEADGGNDGILDRLVFSLGLAEAISYYKAVCPEEVRVLCGTLTDPQRAFWEKLFYNGLGEFMYRNGIRVSREELLKIRCTGEAKKDIPEAEESGNLSAEAGTEGTCPAGRKGNDSKVPETEVLHDERSYRGVLVPVGGGKDSVVSLELLRGEELYTYSVNENDTIRNVIALCDHKKGDLKARRILDRKILSLKEQGYLNGHIPFSAVVAFSTVITAYLNGIREIALSNESSANESTVPGSFVNHQYSKTFEFETDFQNYITSVIDSDIHYFSLLRPLTELQIASLFAKDTAYHKAFRSCNRGSKEGIWCCNCPKCLFVISSCLPSFRRRDSSGSSGKSFSIRSPWTGISGSFRGSMKTNLLSVWAHAVS